MNDYQRGTKDAWELARLICTYGNDCYSLSEIYKIFNEDQIGTIMKKLTYEEAKQKVDEWNNREQYKVGDIIESYGEKAFVTHVTDTTVDYVRQNGKTGGFVIENHEVDWKVTGHVASIVCDTENGIWL